MITRFPFIFKDSYHPPSMHIEFTNACNLKCVYCNNPHFAYPREMMKETTFYNLIEQLKVSKVDRICIGGGEATLHPKFTEFVLKLGEVSKILSIVTNGHWESDDVPKSLLLAPVDFIEISVECEGKENYEATRVGSNYELILRNLKRLKELRVELKSRSHINLRLMVRPTQLGEIERASMKFWEQFGDSIMPQYVQKTREIETISDVFMPVHIAKNQFPKCTLPFRNIQIRANGDVPICQVSGSALIPENKVIAGNINNDSLNKIWREGVFKGYRNAHRQRTKNKMPICQGCRGN